MGDAGGVAALPRRVRVRQYSREDYAAVTKLFVQGMCSYPAHEDAYNLQYINECLSADLADIEGTYLHAGGNFWVAVLDEEDGSGDCGEVAGMVALEKKTDTEGELRRMSVSAKYKRIGIGRLLVAHLETWAKKNGFTTVILNTGTVMPEACVFYKSVGYTETHTEMESDEYEVQCFLKKL
uniref:N-acetyltransferase domain-containing protein n=1 Tax=Globisporangium ultimum (strain ATCC 200006 / CBS 805.95 / DAOM BR144) TaxID=431595 RepID=K3XAQ1_GLOUD